MGVDGKDFTALPDRYFFFGLSRRRLRSLSDRVPFSSVRLKRAGRKVAPPSRSQRVGWSADGGPEAIGDAKAFVVCLFFWNFPLLLLLLYFFVFSLYLLV